MFSKIITKLKSEKGLSEATTAIFVLPIILGALFVMLDVGFYMRSRSMLDTVVQDVVRGVALDGGNNNPRTNIIGEPWSQKGLRNLQNACTNGTIRCEAAAPITLTCGPNQANNVGAEVWCEATITYNVISPLSEGPLGMGLQGLYSEPITVRVVASATTGLTG
jgi:Flp pilus assembly protein TadG